MQQQGMRRCTYSVVTTCLVHVDSYSSSLIPCGFGVHKIAVLFFQLVNDIYKEAGMETVCHGNTISCESL